MATPQQAHGPWRGGEAEHERGRESEREKRQEGAGGGEGGEEEKRERASEKESVRSVSHVLCVEVCGSVWKCVVLRVMCAWGVCALETVGVTCLH
jgi:hypothetical protein